jgi:hypothetical protein
MADPWYTSIESLRAHGFTGFVTIGELRENKLEVVPRQRDDMGVYVVVRSQQDAPEFLDCSTGGRFKGRDPNVSLDELRANWVSHAIAVYVGKAGAPGKSATLRSRLKQYLDFGAGKAVGHWGGRLLWHLPASDNLVVCWKKTPDEVPRDVEKQMICEFKSAYGKRPFGNLSD